jgi:hypothetical protein
MAEALAIVKFLFVLFTACDVGLNRHVVSEFAAGIVDGLNFNVEPVFPAGLIVIDDFYVETLACAKALFH